MCKEKKGMCRLGARTTALFGVGEVECCEDEGRVKLPLILRALCREQRVQLLQQRWRSRAVASARASSDDGRSRLLRLLSPLLGGRRHEGACVRVQAEAGLVETGGSAGPAAAHLLGGRGEPSQVAERRVQGRVNRALTLESGHVHSRERCREESCRRRREVGGGRGGGVVVCRALLGRPTPEPLAVRRHTQLRPALVVTPRRGHRLDVVASMAVVEGAGAQLGFDALAVRSVLDELQQGADGGLQLVELLLVAGVEGCLHHVVRVLVLEEQGQLGAVADLLDHGCADVVRCDLQALLDHVGRELVHRERGDVPEELADHLHVDDVDVHLEDVLEKVVAKGVLHEE
eukprot:Rhum_TRINITY_DN14170_c21_g1::Rhum_TRINITY_DN14170_c21_g1_i1::g.72870::m.72870